MCDLCFNYSLDKYQQDTRAFAVYPEIGKNLAYPTLGLAGESGEVAEKVKKLMRDQGGVVDDKFKAAIKKELGDVMWYVAAIASELNMSLGEIAKENVEKLIDRRTRNVMGGSGDNR